MVTDRAHLRRARLGPGLARLHAEIDRILGVLGAKDALLVDPATLQPAEVLLDLYGEDIRARAFVTEDDGAQMMLRPDFTVPIVRLHMDAGADAARYAYCGPVWRRQDAGSERPREYLQAGFEIFGAADPADADAEVLATIRAALGPAPMEIVTGDMGLVFAAIDALATSPARRAALRRHIWRPARFLALLDRYGTGQREATARRADLLEAHRRGLSRKLVAGAGPAPGLRTRAEVEDRIAGLAAEAQTPPLDPAEVALLEAVLAVEDTATRALARLRSLARETPALHPAIDRFAHRLEALDARGIDPATLAFQGSFGRTTLEYYDGFVFGAIAPGRPDLPPLATGGRYDALTRQLGGRAIPAVGGILRPEALLALQGGAP